MIALAGIIATAAVGLAATAATVIVSRENRTTQSNVAHADRVYNRKADAYLGALRAGLAIENAGGLFFKARLGHLTDKRLFELYSDLQAAETPLRAFGSQRAVQEFTAVDKQAEAFYEAFTPNGGGVTTLPRLARALETFSNVVEQELS
jgi:hypothetical protein